MLIYKSILISLTGLRQNSAPNKRGVYMSQMLLEQSWVPVFNGWMSVTREMYILHTI